MHTICNRGDWSQVGPPQEGHFFSSVTINCHCWSLSYVSPQGYPQWPGAPSSCLPYLVACSASEWRKVAYQRTFKVQCQGLKTQTAEKCFIYGNGGFHGGALLYRTYN